MGREDIFIHRRGQLNECDLGRFAIIPVTNRFYDPLTYLFHVPQGTDG